MVLLNYMRVLVTGSNRGLGFEFTKQYLVRGDEVIGTCRSPKTAKNLQNQKTQFGDKLSIIELDVTDKNSIKKAHKQIAHNFTSIDLLINNAGIISGDGKNQFPLGKIHTEERTAYPQYKFSCTTSNFRAILRSFRKG